jgi:putative two-component system response regulator
MLKEHTLTKARILIVDDHHSNVTQLEMILKSAGYRNLESATDPRLVLSLFTEFQPDLVLLDLHMPHLDGVAIMRQLGSRICKGAYVPIVVLTADTSSEARLAALLAGAKDFLSKPFDSSEVLLRIQNLLETRFLQLRLHNHNQMLEEKVSERTQELEEAQIDTLRRLALAAEYRDDATGQHTLRVGQMSALIGWELGMPEAQVELLRQAAPLHDVGKIAVPDSILLKPGKLTAEEFERVKTHTTVGARILSGSRSPLLQMAEDIALYHHEHWDGTGYAQLKGEPIPLVGRIVAIADVFDALTHERPYKHAWSAEDAVTEIQCQRGRHFDPRTLDAFLRIYEREGTLRQGQVPGRELEMARI